MQKIRRIRRLAFAGLVCMLVGLTPQISAACPTCKDSLHENDAATGYAISILFMMAMPMLIATYWAFTIWRLRRLHFAGLESAGIDPARPEGTAGDENTRVDKMPADEVSPPMVTSV